MNAVLQFLIANPTLIQTLLSTVNKLLDMLTAHPAAQAAVGNYVASVLAPKV